MLKLMRTLYEISKGAKNNPVDRGYLQFELARIRNRRDRMKIGLEAFLCVARWPLAYSACPMTGRVRVRASSETITVYGP